MLSGSCSVPTHRDSGRDSEPAWSTRSPTTTRWPVGADGVAGDRRVSLRSALVVIQVALSLVLVVSAGLFMRTFVSLVRTPLGFDPGPLVVMTVDLQRSRAPSSDRAVIYEQLRETAAGTAGIDSVGISVITPISGSGWNAPIEADGTSASSQPPAGDARRRNLSWVNAVSPDWFATYQMRLIAGRSFGQADRTGSIGVTVVNEAFVERFFPGQNPLGRTVRAGHVAGPGMGSFEVVGVVTNAIYRSARAGTPVTMYVPLAQAGALPASIAFTLRLSIPDGQVRRDLADAFNRLEPAAAFTFRRMDDLVSASRSQERLLAVCPADSAASPSSSQDSGFTGSRRIGSAGGGLRSESGWPWERVVAQWRNSSCAG
jgi:hypothetical protein